MPVAYDHGNSNFNANPYCATGTYTDDAYGGYTNVFCHTIGGNYPMSYPSQAPPVVVVSITTKDGETKTVTQSAKTSTVVQSQGTKAQEGGTVTVLASQTAAVAQGGGGGDGGGGGGAARGGNAPSKSEGSNSKDGSLGSVASGTPAASSQSSENGSASSGFPTTAVIGGALGGVGKFFFFIFLLS